MESWDERITDVWADAAGDEVGDKTIARRSMTAYAREIAESDT